MESRPELWVHAVLHCKPLDNANVYVGGGGVKSGEPRGRAWMWQGESVRQLGLCCSL